MPDFRKNKSAQFAKQLVMSGLVILFQNVPISCVFPARVPTPGSYLATPACGGQAGGEFFDFVPI